tara:strand:- start:324 stop:992 length:669 start_codon:yes stop_codon:yes gene_type:complete
MSNIFTPSKDTEFLNPFGPTMGYYKMPPELVDNLNAGMSESLNDYSDNLVGKVKQELEFTEKTKQAALEGLKDFIAQYSNFSEVRNSFGVRRLNSEKYNYGISIISGWFVRQYEGEYNPIHLHTGARLSCVGYLSLPDGIEKEWEEDYKDHHPSHGHIQFVHGTASGYSSTNFLIKPQVGDFYIFPSELFHCVYPFYTKGERRSFSMNLNFLEVIKEKSVDK